MTRVVSWEGAAPSTARRRAAASHARPEEELDGLGQVMASVNASIGNKRPRQVESGGEGWGESRAQKMPQAWLAAESQVSQSSNAELGEAGSMPVVQNLEKVFNTVGSSGVQTAGSEANKLESILSKLSTTLEQQSLPSVPAPGFRKNSREEIERKRQAALVLRKRKLQQLQPQQQQQQLGNKHQSAHERGEPQRGQEPIPKQQRLPAMTQLETTQVVQRSRPVRAATPSLAHSILEASTEKTGSMCENKDDDDEDDEFDLLMCQVADKLEHQVAHPSSAPAMSEVASARANAGRAKEQATKKDEWNARVLPSFSGSTHRDENLYTRFKVVSLEATNGQGFTMEVRSRPGDHAAILDVRESWAEVMPVPGDYVNVVWTDGRAPNWMTGEPVIIDDAHHLLVLTPDLLVAPTRVTSSLGCLRRSVLAELVQSFTSNKHSVLGNIKHSVVEHSFLPTDSDNAVDAGVPRFDEEHLRMTLEAVAHAPGTVEDLFKVDLSETFAIEEVEGLTRALREFAGSFVKPDLPEGTVYMGKNEHARLRIDRVVATEEKIFSVMWGLKGQPDLLVQASFVKAPGAEPVQVLAPLELKTGRVVQAGHHAQVVLYSLLLADRYRELPIAGGKSLEECAGLLLHISRQQGTHGPGPGPRSKEVAVVQGIRKDQHAVRALIQARNKHAQASAPQWMRGSSSVKTASNAAVEEREDAIEDPLALSLLRSNRLELPPLPPVLQNRDKICSQCYEKATCMLFHRAVENGTAESSGLSPAEFDSVVGHLSESHLKYFREWNHMIDLESSMSIGYQREIWTLSGPERESKGRCVASMQHAETRLDRAGLTSRSFVVVFVRHTAEQRPVSITELQFEKGDFVAISIENAHHVVGSGYVEHVSKDRISLRCSKPLHMPRDGDPSELHWRIDKDERFTGMRTVRSFLTRMLEFDNYKLRGLIFDQVEPGFVDDGKSWSQGSQQQQQQQSQDQPKWLRDNIDLPSSIWSGRHKLRDVRHRGKLRALCNRAQAQRTRKQPVTARTPEQERLTAAYESLNEDQRRAVAAVFAAKDYVCIYGMPGTGKTTTLSFLIQALQKLGCSVLVCSYTHTAVDNLLLKLKEADVSFVRLGKGDQIHPGIREFTLGAETATVESLKELENDPTLVVGTTCMGSKAALLQKRRFDFCIVDEAGQITQPVCFGPLCLADVFVLVGDDRQLPPLVKNEKAKKMGMDVSLLQRLATAHPHAVAKLTIQFRMNRDIMRLANELVYHKQLRAGNVEVEGRSIQFTALDHADLKHSQGPVVAQWLHDALQPSRSVVFLDTDQVVIGGARERRSAMPVSTPKDARRAGDRMVSQRSPCPSPAKIRGAAAKSPGTTGTQETQRHFGRLENDTEARVMQLLVYGLLKAGVRCEDIGIISPYRSQLRLLCRYLGHLEPELEIRTVDRYQGRDKDCILVSLVRSNVTRDVGGLLRDWRRINVAFTRAKKKLLVVGSRSTLQASQIFSSFLRIVEQRKWVAVLPEAAHLQYPHLVNQFAPQGSASQQRVASLK